MADNKISPTKKSFSADWLVGGILTKLGESFDRLTGRNWKPSSSLATSELIERLKKQLDAKVRDLGEKGRFVPHNIKLKMQWDKFSTDAEKSLQKLQNELHAAAIDHINDNRYHTYAPLKVEVKPDYFTEGVDLYVSFDKFAEEESEDVVKVTMPQVSLQNIVIHPEPEPEPEPEKFIAAFKAGEKEKSIELEFKPGKRLSVGRTKENNLMLDDASVSKNHASLVLNAENQLMVADTGSTNGTFINGQRIAYGKALMIGDTDKVKFGTVEVFFRRVPKPTDFATRESYETGEVKTENMPAALNPQTVSLESVASVSAPEQSQPAGIYKTAEDAKIYRTNEDFEVGNGTETGQNIQSESQIFETRQGIKLDFDDDGK
jgi:pSer/pThr/pTyr-binding forkhead associated (FHA) protein